MFKLNPLIFTLFTLPISAPVLSVNMDSWIDSGTFYSHVNITQNSNAIGGHLKLTDTDKIAASYDSDAGGSFNVEYGRLYNLNNTYFFTLDVGYYSYLEENDVAYGGGSASYLINNQLLFSIEYQEAHSLGTESFLEQKKATSTVLWKPNKAFTAMAQYALINPQGLMESVGLIHEYQGYLSYAFEEAVSPYIHIKHRNGSDDTDVSLGFEYKF